MKTVAIDLGGTRTKAGIVERGSVIDYSVTDSFSEISFERTIKNLEQQINALLQKNHIQPSEITGIGLSFPGIVDIKQQQVISTNKKFDEAREFDFIEWARNYANWFIRLENDARAALYGEWQYGAGKGCDNIVMMTLGTGVGGVCLLEGKALYGKHFQAGVLGGHSTIDLNGDKCTCGNIGCVEALASTWKIKDKVQDSSGFEKSLLSNETTYDFATLFRCYREDDELAKDIVKSSLKAWAAGVVNMIHAYDPEMVILHGGVMKSADIILPFIQNYVNKYAWTPWGTIRVYKSSSEDFAALMGMDYQVSKILGNK